MAKKTVLVSDMSGSEIPDGKGATIRVTFRDARKGVRELDVTDAEAEAIGVGRLRVAVHGPRLRAANNSRAIFGGLGGACPLELAPMTRGYDDRRLCEKGVAAA